MQPIDFIIDTASHFVRQKEGPPPGIPAHTAPDFEQELTWMCEWHALTPIVLASLERLALGPNMSRIALERIRALAGASRRLTGDLMDTADRMSGLFRGANVDCLYVGGTSLAATVYPEPGLRPVESIDALVRESQWPTIVEQCQRAGFRMGAGLPFFRAGGEALDYYQYFAPCVLENQTGDRLNLRMRIFGVGHPESQEIAWQHERRLPSSDARVVGIEDELIHSCLLYNMTDFGKLLHAVDIGLILGRFGDTLDWGYVEKRARARSLVPSVFFTLSNVVQWLGLDPSPRVWRRPGTVRKKIFDAVWHSNYDSFAMRRPERVHRLRFHLFEIGGWREKIRFFAALLSPRPEWVAAFFDRPYKPWLKVKFVMLTLKNRVGLRPSGNR